MTLVFCVVHISLMWCGIFKKMVMRM